VCSVYRAGCIVVITARFRFLPVVLQQVPCRAVARHHRQMVPGVTLVVECRPDVDLSGVGVDQEDVGVIRLRRQAVRELTVDTEVTVCCTHLYTSHRHFNQGRRQGGGTGVLPPMAA